MKFSLTITDASAADITRLMALLNGSTANVSTAPSTPASPAIPPMPQTTDDDGDEDGAPVNANAPAIDSSGLPWDERIHSSNRAMTDKGVWRKRRGVPDATVAQVEAELRARTAPQQSAPMFDQSAPTPAQQQQPAAPAPMPVMQMPQPMQQTPAPMPQQPQPAPAPMPQMPAPAPMPQQPQPMQPNGGVSMDFPTFMQALSQQMQKRDANGMPLIDTDYLARVTTEIATAFGVPLGVITDIVSQPRASEMIIYAVQAMTRDGKWN